MDYSSSQKQKLKIYSLCPNYEAYHGSNYMYVCVSGFQYTHDNSRKGAHSKLIRCLNFIFLMRRSDPFLASELSYHKLKIKNKLQPDGC